MIKIVVAIWQSGHRARIKDRITLSGDDIEKLVREKYEKEHDMSMEMPIWAEIEEVISS